MYYDDYDCPECGRYDHGFDMPDTRSTLYISCGCEEREEGGECECEQVTIKVVVRRVFDRECSTCGGADYRCVYDLKLDGKVIKTFKSEDEADAYAAKVFPTAEAPEPDYAWESEKWLRRAEGWG